MKDADLVRSITLDPAKLSAWADKHLVFEARMLAFTARWLSDPANVRQAWEVRNAALESNIVHARCLADFLWPYKERARADARAADFCREGALATSDWMRPEILEVEQLAFRIGPEIVHLGYGRDGVEDKRWNVGGILQAISDGLGVLAIRARDECLSAEAKQILRQPGLLGPRDILPPPVQPKLWEHEVKHLNVATQGFPR